MKLRISSYPATALAALAFGLAAPVQASAQESTPSSSQNTADAEMTEMQAMMDDLFTADPLTAEQEARLPEAEKAVALIVPEGIYGEIVGTTMSDIFNRMLGLGGGIPDALLARKLGQPTERIAALDEESKRAVMQIIDPYFAERGERAMAVMVEQVTEMTGVLEPALREGLTRAYAVRFSAQELADINAFFATPSGAHFAAETLPLYTDPQIMAATTKVMPMIIKAMPKMSANIAEALAGLDDPRGLADLDAEEQAELAELIGITAEDLAATMPEEAPDKPKF
ncbi:DUF2059 domain-containing protein [Altericroceibacterium endophyticum]|uniref:DUF2059 domain-containing protein n=1 Tax=Altericroceibacterium endophyticum TaxID=1808508 RepID=A0A6I4T3D1_9SPHN|nr:DUF2059 domain-containing protein [Altericroceibacterium endophyticum]MXO65764.1 DUF2059 domain-containing protein [Altericroceibacterium endophyticum]